jgi:hypothetical protein
MTDEKAQEVAIALSQNLISFHKGLHVSARTPMIIFVFVYVHNELVVSTKLWWLICAIRVFNLRPRQAKSRKVKMAGARSENTLISEGGGFGEKTRLLTSPPFELVKY